MLPYLEPLMESASRRHGVRRLALGTCTAIRFRGSEGIVSLGKSETPIRLIVTGYDAPLPGSAGFAGAWRALHRRSAERFAIPDEGLAYFPLGRARVTRSVGDLMEDLSKPFENASSWKLMTRSVRDAEGCFSISVEHMGGQTAEENSLWGVYFSTPFSRETLETLTTALLGVTLWERSVVTGGMTGDALWVVAPEGRSSDARIDIAQEVAMALVTESHVVSGRSQIKISVMGAETSEEAFRVANFLSSHGTSLRPDDLWRALALSSMAGLDWHRILIMTEEGAILKNGVWYEDRVLQPGTSLTIHLCRGRCGWRGTIDLPNGNCL